MTKFLLNGTPRDIAAPEPGRTVLEHLRLHERLTGTKEGCAEGDCGACTVVLGRRHGDGLAFEAVNACIMLASELEGCALVTAEGIAAPGAAHPVQTALVDSHASQCGFCTPGFAMSLYAYAQTPPPTDQIAKREKIYDALAGNLCRCTGYRPIMDAALSLPHLPDPREAAWRAALDAQATKPDVLAPATMADLAQSLAAHPGAKLLAGGTDLGVGIAKYGNVPPVMISLSRVAGLADIEAGPHRLIIGAMATYTQILPYLEQHFPPFAAIIRRLGSVQIRNLGTMGGNICNASPIGDSAPCLLALDALVHIRTADGTRQMKLRDFFLAYRKTALQPGEFLQSIEIPFMAPLEKMFTYKLAKRYDQDISTVAAAFVASWRDEKLGHIRAAFGGMAATPKRATALETALLEGAEPAAALARDFQPLSDFRATAAYRMTAAQNLVQKFLLESSDTAQHADVWSL
jgi:xanthine dehydrogenase small subunit